MGAGRARRATVADPTLSLPVTVFLATCAAFFLLNTTLPGVAIALKEGTSVLGSLRADLPLQWSVNGVVIAMAPLVVAVANDSLPLPLDLGLPGLLPHLVRPDRRGLRRRRRRGPVLVGGRAREGLRRPQHRHGRTMAADVTYLEVVGVRA